jgi:hypothetical protein
MKAPIPYDDQSQRSPALVQIWQGTIGGQTGFVAAVRVLVPKPEGLRVIIQYTVAKNREAAESQATVIGHNMGARLFTLMPGFNLAYPRTIPTA